MNAERITKGGKHLGIIHEKDGRWYVTMPNRKNINTRSFKTCGNGIVRHPSKPNQCSEAMTWDSRESALIALHSFNFLLEEIKSCVVVFRNEGDKQEMRGIYLSEDSAREAVAKDLRANEKWHWIDFVLQEEEINP